MFGMAEEEGLLVFLLEDDTALAMGAVYALRSEGFSVLHTSTLKDAKKEIENKTRWPDIFLLDVMIPDGLGYSFCEYIREKRKEEGLEPPPVIFLSAHDNEANIVQGLESGGDDYLTKPFGIRELIARIRSVLRRYKKGEGLPVSKDIYEMGDMKLDVRQLHVMIQGEKISLTSIEFKLLKAMMEANGKPLSREFLLDRIWDMQGEFVDDNTLSVHIRHLREKLEENPANPERLMTIRGVGYLLRSK